MRPRQYLEVHSCIYVSIPMAATVLLLIDIQQGFNDTKYWGSSRSNPGFEDNVRRLLDAFRKATPRPLVVHVRHHSTNPKSPLFPPSEGTEFQPYAATEPGEPVITKNENSAFIGTNLETMLRERGVTRLYICGMTTDQCVSTTARMAANLHVCDMEVDGAKRKGEIYLVGDATAANAVGGFEADLVHKVHQATLGAEFCTAVTTEEAVDAIASH